MLSGCIHRSMNDWLSVNVSTVRTKNVATGADFERAPRRSLTPPDHERQHGDRERDQHRGREGDVADKHPIDDPRREAQQNAHEGSV